jgi:capsular exopolysaccharide synthesis family protein
MSKHFELIQDQVKEGWINGIPGEALVPAELEKQSGGHAASLELDQLAQEESLRLVQRVFLLHGVEPRRAVLFAAIDQGDGCSQVCAQVAETLAKNISGSVCLVDSNFRSPSLPRFFGIGNHYGLTDALLQEGPIRKFARQLEPQNLWLLSSGSLAETSSNLLNSDRLKARVAELRKEFDYVLIDTPPLMRYADALAFGQLIDGLVLVLAANSTRKESAIRVTENLRAAGVQILAAVLNKRTFPIPTSLYRKL